MTELESKESELKCIKRFLKQLKHLKKKSPKWIQIIFPTKSLNLKNKKNKKDLVFKFGVEDRNTVSDQNQSQEKKIL